MASEPLQPFAHTPEWKYTESPNPGFKFGRKVDETPAGREWLKGLESGWEIMDTSKTEWVESVFSYRLVLAQILTQPGTFVQDFNRRHNSTPSCFRFKRLRRWRRELRGVQVCP